jgi:hypothetical protein
MAAPPATSSATRPAGSFTRSCSPDTVAKNLPFVLVLSPFRAEHVRPLHVGVVVWETGGGPLEHLLNTRTHSDITLDSQRRRARRWRRPDDPLWLIGLDAEAGGHGVWVFNGSVWIIGLNPIAGGWQTWRFNGRGSDPVNGGGVASRSVWTGCPGSSTAPARSSSASRRTTMVLQ